MDDAAAPTLDQIMHALDAWHFRYAHEDELQANLTEALELAGLAPQREVRLSAGGRIDILCGAVGIEVKVDGQPAAVERQVARYARSPEIDALVLVTTRVRHRLPDTINSKPVRVLCLAGRALA